MISKTLRTASLAALSLAAVHVAQAGPIDSMLITGTNLIEDRSGELVYSCNPRLDPGSQCTIKAIGDPIQIAPDPDTGVFDVFVGVLDFENVNGVAVGDDRQLTGLFAVQFAGAVGDGGIGTVVLNEAVGPDIFQEIFGVDLTALGYDKGDFNDTLALLYQHDDRVAQGELSTGTFASSVLAAQLGDLAAIVGLVEDDDFFDAMITNLNATTVGGGAAGDTTQLFNLAFGLSFQHYGFNGSFLDGAILVDRLRDGATIFADIGGTGSNTKPAGQGLSPGAFHIGNDIQAQWVAVPEPSTLGLLGLSLLAVGAAARRRRAA